MRKFILLFCILLSAVITRAQTEPKKEVFAFRITDYTVVLNDSITVVQLELPEPIPGIEKGALGALNGNFSNKDTGYLGGGKCHLVKGMYYYFSIVLKDQNKQPQKNDLLYTRVNFTPVYKGQIFKLLRNSIYLLAVDGGKKFYDLSFAQSGTKTAEVLIIDQLVDDIKYTAKEMIKMNDGQDVTIGSGRFKGKKLFAAMQEIKSTDVMDLLDYMIARPVMYAGNDWKVSEVFATWINGGAPTVTK